MGRNVIEPRPFHRIAHKVRRGDFADPASSEPLALFPRILAGKSLRRLVSHWKKCTRRGYPVIFGMGAHVVKCGLSPWVVEWIRQGRIQYVLMNGAGVIHDVEIALFGETSEEVERGLKEGSFGGGAEGNDWINRTVAGARKGRGYGSRVSRALLRSRPPFASDSILCQAAAHDVPVFVALAVVNDVNQLHPGFSPGRAAAAAYRDFQLFCDALLSLREGGLFLHVGSAVVLPETLLKAMAVLANRGVRFKGTLACNLDFASHYRAQQQVVRRFELLGGRSLAMIGHHEILLPVIGMLLRTP